MIKTNKKIGKKVSMLVSLLVGMVMLFSGISLISAKPAKNSSIKVFADTQYVIHGETCSGYALEDDENYAYYFHKKSEEGYWEYSNDYGYDDSEDDYFNEIEGLYAYIYDVHIRSEEAPWDYEEYDLDGDGVYNDGEVEHIRSEEAYWEWEDYDGGEYDYDETKNGIYIDKDYVHSIENDDDWYWEYEYNDDDGDGIYVGYNLDKWMHRYCDGTFVYEYYFEEDWGYYVEPDNEYEEPYFNSGTYYNDMLEFLFDGHSGYEPDFGATVIGFVDGLDLDAVTIPATVTTSEDGTMDVVALGYNLFSGQSIKKCTISETTISNEKHGAKKISYNCFENSDLEELTLPSTLTTIESNSFAYCSNFRRLNIPNIDMWFNINMDGFDLTYENYIYLGSLEDYRNPFEYTSQYYFDEDEGLFVDGVRTTSITVPNGTLNLPNCIFAGWTFLETIKIPSSLEYICYDAFKGCEGLHEVYIDDLESWCNIEMQYYKNGSWDYRRGCPFGSSAYCSIVHDNGGTFDLYVNNVKTTALDLSGYTNLKEIGELAFFGFEEIVSVVLPSNLEVIGDSAFEACSKLASITTTGNKLGSVGEKAFDNCDDSIFLTEGIYKYVKTTNNDHWLLYNVSDHTQASYEINENTKVIGYGVFSGCTNITGFDFPTGLTGISSNAFYRCNKLTQLTLPSGVVRIGREAFRDCTLLESIDLGVSVTLLEQYCFQDCKALTSITIPGSCKKISSYAFRNCTSLASLTLKDGVEHIFIRAFDGCNALSAINIDSIAGWVNIVFGEIEVGGSGYSNLADTTPMAKARHLYMNGEEVTDVVVPEGITKINDYSFYNCLSIESIVIPGSVTEIGSRAFQGCENLVDVTLNEGLQIINEFTFIGCSKLGTVVIPSTVTSAEGAFRSSGIKKIVFSEGTTSIDRYICYTCSSLEEVVFPSTLKTIGSNAFYQCSKLKYVILPEGFETLGTQAFTYCSGIKTLVLPSTTIFEYSYSYSVFSNCTGVQEIYTAYQNSISGISGTWKEYKVVDGEIVVVNPSVYSYNVKGGTMTVGNETVRYYRHFIKNTVSTDDLFILELQAEERLAEAPEGSNLWTLSDNGKTAYMVCSKTSGVYGPLPTAQDGSPVIWRNSEDEEISAFQFISNEAVTEAEKTVTQFTPPPPPETGVVVSVGSVALLIALVVSLAVVLKKKEQY